MNYQMSPELRTAVEEIEHLCEQRIQRNARIRNLEAACANAIVLLNQAERQSTDIPEPAKKQVFDAMQLLREVLAATDNA